MIEVVSFDVWGTLLLSNPAYKQNQRELLADALGFSGDPAELRPFISEVFTELDKETERAGTQLGMVDRVTRLADRLELPVPDRYKLYQLKVKLTDAQLSDMPLMTEPILPELFGILKQKGLRLAVVSNTNMTDGAIVHKVLARHGLAQHLSVELYSDELGYAKPDPRIFCELIARSGVSPEHIVHVGDNPVTDKKGASACGLNAILYDRKRQFTVTTGSIWTHNNLLSTFCEGRFHDWRPLQGYVHDRERNRQTNHHQ